jgi:hypothetical protein
MWHDCVLLFVVALVVRGGFGLVRMQQSADPAALEFPDEHQYWFMAGSLARGDGLRDDMGFRASRMPLYPAFLSLFVDSPDAIAIAKASQWIIGAMAAPLIAALGQMLAGRRVGIIAGLMVAFDPFLIFFSSLLLTETLSITALVALWLLLAGALTDPPLRDFWARWFAIGVTGALCVYLRESNLGLVVLAIIFTVVARRRDRAALRGGILALLCVVVSLVPWAVRNRTVLGEWCCLTTRAGISLYDGVGPQATGASDLGSVQRTGMAAELSETQWNEYFKRESWSAIRRDPARIARLAGRKLLRMWNPLPNVETYRGGYTQWISAIWTVPIFILAIAGAVRWMVLYRRKGLVVIAFLLLPAVYFSLLHSLYIGSVRYRLPAIPMIAVLAALSFMPRLRRDSTT